MQYQGRLLTAAELTQVRGILAKAGGVAPAAVRLLPYHPAPDPDPGPPQHHSDFTTKIDLPGSKDIRI